MGRWDAERYKKTKAARISEVDSLLSWTGYQFAGNERVLDIGCGNGMVSNYLCQKYPGITMLAIDNSSEMLNAAVVDYAEVKNLNFKLMDAREINFNSEFNLIISIACLHWVKEQDKVLQEIYSAASPGASILIRIYMKQPYLWEALEEVCKRNEWIKYFENFENTYNFYEKNGYQNLAERAGFHIKKIEEITYNCNFVSQQVAEDLFASWLPHMHKLPENLHVPFIKEVCNMMLESMNQDGIKDFTEYKAASLNIYMIKDNQ